MCEEANRDMSHYEMQKFVWRRATTFADHAQIEKSLANGRKADVYFEWNGERAIVEVKTQLKDSMIENAWLKYSSQCDYLAIACPPGSYQKDDGGLVEGWKNTKLLKIGVLWVDWEGITVIHPARRLGKQAAQTNLSPL